MFQNKMSQYVYICIIHGIEDPLHVYNIQMLIHKIIHVTDTSHACVLKHATPSAVLCFMSP